MQGDLTLSRGHALRRRGYMAWVSYSACLVGYLYASRFIPDATLAVALLAFALFGRLKVNVAGLSIVLVVIVLAVVQVFAMGGRIEHPAQLLHLFFLLIMALAIDDRDFDPRLLVWFCMATTTLNCLLLAGTLVPGVKDIVLWGADRTNSLRFQGVLPEPSFLALHSTLNFFVLLRANRKTWAFANLAPLVATFSFSGLIVFLLMGVVFLRSAWKPLSMALIAIVTIAGLAYVMIPDIFMAQLVLRGAGIVAGGGEESFTLRVLAPYDLMRSIFTGDNTLYGLGSGNVEHYIQYNQVELPHHWRGDGLRSTEPDSVIAFVVAAYGLLGAMVAFAIAWLLLSRSPSRREYRVIRWFILAMTLFTGLFISLHFLVWFYLLRQERLHSENSSAGSPTAIST